MNSYWYKIKSVQKRHANHTACKCGAHICLVHCWWRKGPLMARGGKKRFPDACLEFYQDFLPCFKGSMVWSPGKTGIRGRVFLHIIILLQDSKDIPTSTSALARSPKCNYYSSSLTPGCSRFPNRFLDSPRAYVLESTLRKTGLLDRVTGRKSSCSVQWFLGLKWTLAAKIIMQSKENWTAFLVNGIDSLRGKNTSLSHH